MPSGIVATHERRSQRRVAREHGRKRRLERCGIEAPAELEPGAHVPGRGWTACRFPCDQLLLKMRQHDIGAERGVADGRRRAGRPVGVGWFHAGYDTGTHERKEGYADA